jgi:signal transduction histidine kinase
MTEQKLIEQQKDEFIGIASHELRTPVTSIKAYAEVLQEMFEESGDMEHAALMKKMDAQVDRLTQLIRSLLDVTKLTEGKLEFQKDRFDLNELVADTRDELQRTTKHPLEFTPQPLGRVCGDAERIRQVLTNIISNAIKYSPEQKPVIISTREEGGEAIVCVQDFGIGMSEEVSRQVFSRFFRSNEPGINTYPGLGLGLYISAEFIQRHGGRIWVEATGPGKGSIFCFSLPLDNREK